MSNSAEQSKKDEKRKDRREKDESPRELKKDSRGNQSSRTPRQGHSTSRHEEEKKTSPRPTESSQKQKKTTKEKSTNDEKSMKEDKSTKEEKAEGATLRRSPNKIYRTPPTPVPEQLFVRERSFTLDCIAVNSTSNDYARAKPKLGQVIQPYNSQKDKNIEAYFNFLGIDRTLKKTGQTYPGHSIEGPVVDRFFESGAGYRYLSKRNIHGCGHSSEEADGHAQFMNDIKPVPGYNGRFGYRRNNPWLRYQPSPFGVGTSSPIH